MKRFIIIIIRNYRLTAMKKYNVNICITSASGALLSDTWKVGKSDCERFGRIYRRAVTVREWSVRVERERG